MTGLEILVGFAVGGLMLVAYVMALYFIDRYIERKHGYRVEDLRRPSTLRPSDPPKGQGRRYDPPVVLDEDFWMPSRGVPSVREDQRSWIDIVRMMLR